MTIVPSIKAQMPSKILKEESWTEKDLIKWGTLLPFHHKLGWKDQDLAFKYLVTSASSQMEKNRAAETSTTRTHRLTWEPCKKTTLYQTHTSLKHK